MTVTHFLPRIWAKLAITHLFAHVDCFPGNSILYTRIHQYKWTAKERNTTIYDGIYSVFYMYISVAYFVLQLMDVPLFAACDFNEYYIRGGEASSVPSTWYGCLPYLVETLPCQWMTAQPLEVKWILFITSKRHVTEWKKMCAWNFYWEECLFTLNFCHYPSRTKNVPSSVSTLYHCLVRATRALTKYLFPCFVMRGWLPLIPTCGSFPCM